MFGPKMELEFDQGKGGGVISIQLSPPNDEKAAAEIFTGWLNDNRVRLFLTSPFPCILSSEEEWIRKSGNDESKVNWSIYQGGTLLGNADFHKINLKDRRAEIGLMIGDKESWGKGIAPAASAIILDYAFNNLVAGGLHKVIARVMVGNERSQKTLAKIGFQEVGTHKENHWFQGRWFGEWVGEILQADWRIKKDEIMKTLGIIRFNLYPGCEDLGFGEEVITS